MARNPVGLSLFWRTFFLLLLLLAVGVPAWVAALRAMDNDRAPLPDPQALATLVQVLEDTLRATERPARTGLLKALAQRQHLVLQPRNPADLWKPLIDDRAHRELATALHQRLGPGLVLASGVNGAPGLWLGLTVDREAWWLQLPARPDTGLDDELRWAGVLVLSLLGTVFASVLIARRINRPLQDLSFAASKIRGGEYDSRLDETTITSEIREVNMGFNRMARELAKVEEDRAVMLAGISHDLRTPLARLRLEAEMSVFDDEARHHMASDIEQLDRIIDKFMDYARPGETHLKPVLLGRLIDKEAASFRDPSEIQISNKVAIDIHVQADEVELGRVFANLFENARRYGRTADTGVAIVQVSYVRAAGWVICSVRDHGLGVPAEKLGQLTTPFFRGDAARTAATGAGLGLAIVEKAMQRMGGTVEVANAPDGGLLVHLRLKHVKL
ncbi:MAG: two-component sensor histidine kinase [Burkholderiales bacterium PBB5]|nr:MAG: two-component sensor histidine kinase [Burkholderiales bacterium PBB5]